MIKVIIPYILAVLAITRCGSNANQNESIDFSDSAVSTDVWKDSLLAEIPNMTLYYCDTTIKSDLGVRSCIDVVTNNFRRTDNGYYVITQGSIQSGDTAACDTFYITRQGNWYNLHNDTSKLFFSRSAFRSNEKNSVHRHGFIATSIEEWIPDSQYVSLQYGEMYIFEIDYPLSRESNNGKIHFSPYYGPVHYVNETAVFSVSRIDSVK